MTEDSEELIGRVIENALAVVEEKRIPVYTFALYFDHESPAVSACVDTEENSRIQVLQQNRYSMRYFHEHICDGDLAQAALWQANVGRNLSLGDFVLVNVAREEMDAEDFGSRIFACMARQLSENEKSISRFALNADDLLFCCSTQNSEVGLVWSFSERVAQ